MWILNVSCLQLLNIQRNSSVQEIFHVQLCQHKWIKKSFQIFRMNVKEFSMNKTFANTEIIAKFLTVQRIQFEMMSRYLLQFVCSLFFLPCINKRYTVEIQQWDFLILIKWFRLLLSFKNKLNVYTIHKSWKWCW